MPKAMIWQKLECGRNELIIVRNAKREIFLQFAIENDGDGLIHGELNLDVQNVQCLIETLMNFSGFNPAIKLGRLGGKARSARMTAAERSQAASKAAGSRWAGFTPEQRSAEMKRRRKKGLTKSSQSR